MKHLFKKHAALFWRCACLSAALTQCWLDRFTQQERTLERQPVFPEM